MVRALQTDLLVHSKIDMSTESFRTMYDKVSGDAKGDGNHDENVTSDKNHEGNKDDKNAAGGGVKGGGGEDEEGDSACIIITCIIIWRSQ